MKKEKTMNENENPNVNEEPVVAPAPQPQTEAPVYASPIPEEPVKKKGFPKVLLIVLAVLAVGAIAFFGIRAAASGKPLNKVALGAKKTAEALEKSAPFALAENLGNSGSVAVSIDLSKLSDVLRMDIPATINLTSYADAKSSKGALVFDALLKNKSVVNGTLTFSEEEIAAACDALLGKTAYGLSFKNLAKNLPGSVLDPKSDSDYALPEEIYDWLVSLKNGPIAPAKELTKQGKAVAEAAAQVLLKSLEKNADITKASETISIGEKDVKTTAVTIELNGKQAAAVATDLLKWAKSDKDLKKLLTSVTDTYGPLMEYDGQDPDDFIDEFYEGIDDELDKMGDAEKDDLDLTCVFYVSNSGGQMVKAEITTKNDYGKIVYTLEGGPDWKNPTYISVTQKNSYSKQTVTYTVEENTKSQFTAKIKVKADNTSATITFSWDKSSGDLRISSSDLDLKLTGSMTQKGKETTIVLKKLEYDGMTVKDLGTTIVLSESAKVPTISKTTDLLTLSEDDFEDLGEDVKEAVQDLVEKIRDEMY